MFKQLQSVVKIVCKQIGKYKSCETGPLINTYSTLSRSCIHGCRSRSRSCIHWCWCRACIHWSWCRSRSYICWSRGRSRINLYRCSSNCCLCASPASTGTIGAIYYQRYFIFQNINSQTLKKEEICRFQNWQFGSGLSGLGLYSRISWCCLSCLVLYSRISVGGLGSLVLYSRISVGGLSSLVLYSRIRRGGLCSLGLYSTISEGWSE